MLKRQWKVSKNVFAHKSKTQSLSSLKRICGIWAQYIGLLDQQLPTKSCDNGHATASAKESQLYGYHGTLAAKRKVSWCVCVTAFVSFMWVIPPCLMAPRYVQRPALSCSLLSHSCTQTNARTQRGRFLGVPHPNTPHNTPATASVAPVFQGESWSVKF